MGRLRTWWNGLSRRAKIVVSAVAAVIALALIVPQQPDDAPSSSPSPGASAALASASPTPSSTRSVAPPSSAPPSTAATGSPVATFDFEKPIPGLAAVDVTGNLSDRGFDCGDMELTDSGVLYECIYSDGDVEQRVYITGTSPGQIKLVDSTALDFTATPGDSARERPPRIAIRRTGVVGGPDPCCIRV